MVNGRHNIPEQVDESSADACSLEQIHHCGAIQPHGFMVILDGRNLALVSKSSNVDAIFPDSPLHVCPNWLPSMLVEACGRLAGDKTGSFDVATELAVIGQVDMHCFAMDDLIFCEFERTKPAPTDQTDVRQMISAAQKPMTRALTVAKISTITCDLIRSLTGFERVLVYRFDTDGSGEVIGESIVEDWQQSLLGLHFPAFDIPAQARNLYAQTLDRWMPDRDYQPVPLIPETDGLGRPFNLSNSRYRSVSPLHRMYQKNIGANGAMSISIMLEGQLWGLIIGHHRQCHQVPRYLHHHVQSAVQNFTAHVRNQSIRDMKQEVEDGVGTLMLVLSKLTNTDDYLKVLIQVAPRLLEIVPGCSGTAVLWTDPKVGTNFALHGNTPAKSDLVILAHFLRRKAQEGIFASDCLSRKFPPFQKYTGIASGVLSIYFKDDRQTALLMFRPEVTRSVNWAGKPEKLENDEGQLSLPRKSFDTWTEIKRGYSLPWKPWEMDTATAINEAVNGQIEGRSLAASLD